MITKEQFQDKLAALSSSTEGEPAGSVKALSPEFLDAIVGGDNTGYSDRGSGYQDQYSANNGSGGVYSDYYDFTGGHFDESFQDGSGGGGGPTPTSLKAK